MDKKLALSLSLLDLCPFSFRTAVSSDYCNYYRTETMEIIEFRLRALWNSNCEFLELYRLQPKGHRKVAFARIDVVRLGSCWDCCR